MGYKETKQIWKKIFLVEYLYAMLLFFYYFFETYITDVIFIDT
jgi:hypothetical protein